MTVVPSTMACIVADAPGGPDVLKIGQRPVPTLENGEVLIRVAAAGINRAEVIQRQGNYPAPPGATDILGLEVAGTVALVGPGVTSLKVGDKIAALVNGGGYAEYCKVAASHCLPAPKGMSWIEAGSLPETAFTVWHNIYDRSGLRPGETLLVHGGASGIGVMAIQMATALGSKVIATAAGPEKRAACARLGAVLAIDYKAEDFVAAVKKFTQDRGVDVIIDMVGGDYMERNLEALAMEGRLINISYMKGSKMEVDFSIVMRKRLRIAGSTLRPQSVEAKAAMARSLREKVWPLVEQGRIRPVIDSTFPLARAADAHRRMESNQHIGKIMLSVGESGV
ncbi:MAG: NAD(P)H-quinone oxidoreductase [Rhodospirillales bacterium]|nr:NAD(P)H-quinone oxidoreductase [Rhodospirillales bacterium]